MDTGGLKPNIWQRFEHLGSAWIQAKRGITDSVQGTRADDFEAVSKPSRRTRTPLTDSEVNAIRTARVSGESVVSISRRFAVHRMTVWTYTKDLIA